MSEPSSDTCAICLAAICAAGDALCVRPSSCEHVFCEPCLNRWALCGANLCPLCKVRFSAILDKASGLRLYEVKHRDLAPSPSSSPLLEQSVDDSHDEDWYDEGDGFVVRSDFVEYLDEDESLFPLEEMVPRSRLRSRTQMLQPRHRRRLRRLRDIFNDREQLNRQERIAFAVSSPPVSQVDQGLNSVDLSPETQRRSSPILNANVIAFVPETPEIQSRRVTFTSIPETPNGSSNADLREIIVIESPYFDRYSPMYTASRRLPNTLAND